MIEVLVMGSDIRACTGETTEESPISDVNADPLDSGGLALSSSSIDY